MTLWIARITERKAGGDVSGIVKVQIALTGDRDSTACVSSTKNLFSYDKAYRYGAWIKTESLTVKIWLYQLNRSLKDCGLPLFDDPKVSKPP